MGEYSTLYDFRNILFSLNIVTKRIWFWWHMPEIQKFTVLGPLHPDITFNTHLSQSLSSSYAHLWQRIKDKAREAVQGDH